MLTKMSFAVFDEEGIPLEGLSPQMLVHRGSTGTVRAPLTISDVGGGFYEFSIDVELTGPSAYLVDCGVGAATRYVYGSTGELVSLVVLDSEGNLLGGATPEFYSWEDGTLSPPVQPTIVDFSGGLYGFMPPEGAGTLVRYLVGTEHSKYWGSVEAVDPAVFPVLPESVSDLFRQLSYGELHDLKLANDGLGTIKLERRNQVVHLANEALKALHQKFPLLVVVETTVVPGNNVPHYVTLNPSTIQVISILTTGSSLTFLTHPVPGQVYVFNGKIHFPARQGELPVQIAYQRRHPLLRPVVVDDTDVDMDQPIYLVPELWPALRAYIAGEMYGNMNTADAKNSAAEYRAKYSQICSEVEFKGGVVQGILDDQKFGIRGFV